MNALAQIEARIATALDSMKSDGTLPPDIDTSHVDLEATRDPSHGDLATNAAMVLAKTARMKPRDIAEQLRERLGSDGLIVKAEIAGPGFLNLTLAPSAWQAVIKEVLRAGDAYGRARAGSGDAINVEYVSANPTGPMHVGHCRGAVFGDALANLLAYAGAHGDARILHQRCRRPGRRPRAVGLSALPRGPGRGDRRHSRGSLPRATT